MSVPAGTRLGAYEILSPLGAGGMGEVYRARDTKLGREVAIKVLPEEFYDKKARIARFEREATSLAAVSHPHIAALYSFEEAAGRHLLVMELAEGETLADRLGKGPLPPALIVKIGVEITSALDAAHRVGVVHRDLKPANVMLTRAGVKLLDFGLAKALAPDAPADGLSSAPTSARDVTREGEIFGTLSYMAPEQLEGKKPDSRTDIFALGATLYEMATGRKAFSGTSQASVISSIMTSEPQPISVVQPMTPPELERVVKICLAKDPDDRWQSARDVGLQLRDAAAPQAQPFAAKPQRLRLAAAAVGLWLGAAGLTAVLMKRPPVDVEPVVFTVPPPTRAPFSSQPAATGFSVSPDGRTLALVARDDSGQDVLWLRPMGTLSGRSLLGTEGASAPFWSPDSRWIGYFSGGKLLKIELSGGTPLPICGVAGPFPTGTWGSRGEILFSHLIDDSIRRVSAAGGAPVPVLKSDTETLEGSVCFPRFLPDSRHFLFVVRSYSAKQLYVRLGDLDTGKSSPLLTDCSRAEYAPSGPTGPSGSGFLLFVRGGSLLAQPFDASGLRLSGEPRPVVAEVMHHAFTGMGAFTASRTGLLAYRASRGPALLQWLDRQGHLLGMEGKPGLYENVRLSPDDRKFAVNVADPRTSTFALWIGSGGILTRFTFGIRDDHAPVWSPDGSKLVFSTGSSRGPPHLYEASLDGGEPRELTLPGNVQWVQDWSRDGKFISYSELSLGTRRDIWILDRAGTGNPAPFLATPFDEVDAQFSPDGRWIAYSSDESGSYEIYVVSFPKAWRKVRVSNAGGTRPRWRRDGRELFYVSEDNRMTSVAVRPGESPEVGAPQPLFGIEVAGWRDYDVSADGTRFLVVVNAGEQRSRFISVTTNWLAALKERR